MASTIFKKIRNTLTRSRLYSVEFSREGRGLKQHKQTTAEQQMELSKGRRGFFPKGTDTDTPGFHSSTKR